MTPWDWVVRGYRDNVMVTETVHRGDSSKDMEVEILQKRPDITDLSVHRWMQGDPNPISDWERTQKRTRKRGRVTWRGQVT